MPRLETRVAKMEKAAAPVDLKAMTDDELLATKRRPPGSAGEAVEV